MIDGCGAQLRLAAIPGPEGWITRPVGLDFTAVMLTAAAAGADVRMLADILPRIEAAIINPAEPEPMEADDDDS